MVTVAHELELVDLPAGAEVPVDIICTNARTLRVPRPLARPAEIPWHLVSQQQLESIPARELKMGLETEVGIELPTGRDVARALLPIEGVRPRATPALPPRAPCDDGLGTLERLPEFRRARLVRAEAGHGVACLRGGKRVMVREGMRLRILDPSAIDPSRYSHALTPAGMQESLSVCRSGAFSKLANGGGSR